MTAIMLAIAFIGTIQHEITAEAVKKLVSEIKAEAGCGCIVACNANGLFASAPKLDKQLEMLFDSGIDLVMVGEQGISRSCCRSVFAKSRLPLLKPMNLFGSTEENSTKTMIFQGRKLCFVSLMDNTGKIPADPSHTKLDEFLRNKCEGSIVIINESGTDYKYLKALAWKCSGLASPLRSSLILFGSGSGEATAIDFCFGSNCCLQQDAGSVVTENTICGFEPEQWWKKEIERRPLTMLPKWGRLKCDYSIVWINEREIEKFCSRSVRI